MGMCSSFSRIGGILTPYIADVLIKGNYSTLQLSSIHSHFYLVDSHLPVYIYAGACLVATVVALLLPYETMNMKLKDSYENDEDQETKKKKKKAIVN
jgi:fucose permease